MGRPWNGIGMVEGKATGDGRYMEPGALTWADPPLPLTWQKASSDGHDGEVVVGTIEMIAREGANIVGSGTLLDNPEAAEVTALLEAGVLGLSAQLDDDQWEFVYVDAAGNVIPEDQAPVDEGIDIIMGAAEAGDPEVTEQMRWSAGRIRNFCICTTPAFVECTIQLADPAAAPDAAPDDAEQCPPGQHWDPATSACVDDAAAAPTPPPPPPPASACTHGVVAGACCLACQASGGSCADDDEITYEPVHAVVAEAVQFQTWRKAGRAGGTTLAAARAADLAAHKALTYKQVRGLFAFFARNAEHRHDEGWHTGDPGYPSPGRVAWAAHGGDAAYGWARTIIERTEGQSALALLQETAWSLAAGAPARPPLAWFQDPHLDGPTSLTVTAEGRVFGHLAPFDSCHMGIRDRCVSPPRSRSAYAHFHQGRVITAEGTTVPAGKITLDTRHAALDLDRYDTVAHYEHTGAVVADVVAGEDDYGVWLAGSLRPTVTDQQRLSLERSALSGDWRRVGPDLELVAALAVNVPGFPIVRGRVASGAPAALVAGGVVEADRRDRHRRTGRRHDPRLVGVADAIAASIGRGVKDRVAELDALVHG